MRENLSFQIRFFEDILSDHPDFIDVLIPLGDAYTRRGLHQKGLAVDMKLASLLPDDPVVFYNLACSHALLGSRRQALAALSRALRLGYRDREWLERDKDLDGIRHLPAFKKLTGKYFQA
jgi:tetratricopeptide (TPR) repeat protein